MMGDRTVHDLHQLITRANELQEFCVRLSAAARTARGRGDNLYIKSTHQRLLREATGMLNDHLVALKTMWVTHKSNIEVARSIRTLVLYAAQSELLLSLELEMEKLLGELRGNTAATGSDTKNSSELPKTDAADSSNIANPLK